MAARTTGFKDGPRMLVFRKVEEILRADPVLVREVKRWQTWNGEGGDAMPAASGMMPLLRMSPVMFPNQSLSVSRIAAFLGIRVQIAVAGLYAEDIVNYWDAVEDALCLGKPFQEGTVYCTLQGLKAYTHKFETPGIDAWKSADNPPNQFLQGAGMLVLRISRDR